MQEAILNNTQGAEYSSWEGGPGSTGVLGEQRGPGLGLGSPREVHYGHRVYTAQPWQVEAGRDWEMGVVLSQASLVHIAQASTSKPG